jgi:hypothetical protein
MSLTIYELRSYECANPKSVKREDTFRREWIGKTKRSITATTVIDKSANTHSNVDHAT